MILHRSVTSRRQVSRQGADSTKLSPGILLAGAFVVSIDKHEQQQYEAEKRDPSFWRSDAKQSIKPYCNTSQREKDGGGDRERGFSACSFLSCNAVQCLRIDANPAASTHTHPQSKQQLDVIHCFVPCAHTEVVRTRGRMLCQKCVL